MFENKYELATRLNCLVNSNGILYLEPLDASRVENNVQPQATVTKNQRRYETEEKPKREVLYLWY